MMIKDNNYSCFKMDRLEFITMTITGNNTQARGISLYLINSPY